MSSTGEININWDSLVDSIGKGETVLVLGPDAIPLYPINEAQNSNLELRTEVSFNKLLKMEVLNKLSDGINYFYAKDGLFLFKDGKYKNKARDIVRTLADKKKWITDEDLLKKIVSFPFSVILNLSPDSIVYEAYLKYSDIIPQFDFCTPYNKEKGNIKKISKNEPLIYNLCGNASQKKDSPILDYFDLFQLFTKLLGNDEQIPDELKRKLQDADKFILLGFELDRWYFQLFIHYLNWIDKHSFENLKENFPMISQISEDNKEFIVKQFNISHIAPSRKEFDKLYSICESKSNLLRKLNSPNSPLIENVYFYIKQDKIEETFSLLNAQKKEQELIDELVLLSARYARWKNSRHLEYKENSTIEINKICSGLLHIASQISE